VEVRLYATLRDAAKTGAVDIPVQAGETVGEVLHRLVARYPRLSQAIWKVDGSLAGHVAVVLNGRDVRHLDGVDTKVSADDRLDVFPPVGGGADAPGLTRVTLRFTSHFRERVAASQAGFSFKGNTMRQFIEALLSEYDIRDLLMDQGELRPYVRVAVNGRFSHFIGAWDAAIPDGATVVLMHSYVLAF
jgi:molybdopterin synthase sulfur carrier subunit